MKSALIKPVYIDGAIRTPIGKFRGALKGIPAPKLAALALKEALARYSNLPLPEFVFLGHARQAGAGPNPARQVALAAGLPESTPAMTLNLACASGLMSVITGAEKIGSGRAGSIWAGGVESMSNTPYLLMGARFGMKMGHSEVTDGMHQDGFFCPMSKMVMGQTVDEFLAKELGISRESQDQYACESQRRAEVAWKAGKFNSEIFEILQEGKNPGLKSDEHRRGDTTIENLKGLKPVFDPKNGSVTAGNSSGITDGAAFVHLSESQGVQTQAEILDYEIVALDPRRMGLGPVPATENLLKRQGLKISDLEAVELNEAFAAQVLACQRNLKIPEEKLNAWGGAIALGHPIGATGTRILVTLLSRLKGKTGALGLATLCVSGGHGVSLLVRAR